MSRASRAAILAEELVRILAAGNMNMAAAESCTAGLASDCIARIPGASKALWGSFVCYTADAKEKMLGVSESLIREFGVVSEPVALAMAEGALGKSGASWAFSVTGFAGPGGDSAGVVPVGTVWIGIAGRNIKTRAKKFLFPGSRSDVREAAAMAALGELLETVRGI